MAQLPGLTGLYGTGTLDGINADQWALPVAPGHADTGDPSPRNQVNGTANPPEPALPGGLPDVESGSGPVDGTPVSYAAPWPVPHTSTDADDAWQLVEQSQLLHGADLGGVERVTRHIPPVPLHVSGDDARSSNVSILEKSGPQMASASRGPTDVDQGLGVGNDYGFDSGHYISRTVHDDVPLDHTLDDPGGRPFIGTDVRFNNPVTTGPMPYSRDADTSGTMDFGPTVMTDPTPYDQPPNPSVSAGQLPEAPVSNGWVLI